jgi:hypothetical protein
MSVDGVRARACRGALVAAVGELGRLGLNDGGDVALQFLLTPPGSLEGLNAGLYRFSHASGALSAVAIPGTPMPGAGALEGLWFDIVGMNNRGDITFTGLADGTDINPGTPPGSDGIAGGVWEALPDGTLVKVAIPGDPAPGGGTFDDARNPSINNGGDIAFGGHIAGETCYQSGPFLCTESLYLRDAATGAIRSIAHQGDPAPGRGNFAIAFGALVNSSDQIAFLGALNPPDPITGAFTTGVFRWSHGTTIAIARPGDAMPGGGHLVSANGEIHGHGINNQGDVSFVATLDTSSSGTGPDMGAYVYSNGAIHVVARTGTVIAGVGTIAYFGSADVTLPFATGGAINEREDVLLAATMTNGQVALLVASPTRG